MYKLKSSTKMDAKKKKNDNKLVTILVSAGLAIAGLNMSARVVAHNIMSHAGFRTNISMLKDPKVYLTRGHYKGFKNNALDTQDGPEIDPIVYAPDPDNKLSRGLHNIDLNAIYLGLQSNPLPISQYKPTRLTDADRITFYSLKPFIKRPEMLVGMSAVRSYEGIEKILNMNEGDALSIQEVCGYTSFENHRFPVTLLASLFTNVDLANYTLSFGKDEKGVYTSVYDKWDFAPNAGYFKDSSGLMKLASKFLPKIGTPIHFYDRFYWKDYGFDENKQGDIQHGN